jgi:rRNA maturation RNase YbeY
MAAINFFSEDVKFRLKERTIIRRWILNTIRNEGFKIQSVNYVFCSDTYLLDYNIRYLKHNTLTDIITFSFAESGEKLEGDIFISVERVEENSVVYKELFEDELRRVIIHGILHLMGYLDKSIEDSKIMRAKEAYYLQTYNELLVRELGNQ